MDVRTDAELFADAALLVERFGRWPTFHDAEVIRVELSRVEGVVLSMDVYVFAAGLETDERGYYKLKNESLVTLVFRGVEEMSLVDFNEQNVLSGLSCSRAEDGRIRVQVDGVYGLGGSFACAEARVSEVRPWSPREE